MKGPQRSDEQLARRRERSSLTGDQGWYLEQLYQRYCADPDSLPGAWRQRLAEWTAAPVASGERANRPLGADAPTDAGAIDHRLQIRVESLMRAYRQFGHWQATLNPLPMQAQRSTNRLDLSHHGLDEAHLDHLFHADSLGQQHAVMSLRKIIEHLRRIYCGNVGVEYTHLSHAEEVEWIQRRIEERDGDYSLPDAAALYVFERLTAAEGLEHYLATRYPGTKRFGLEGSETLLPALDALVRLGCQSSITETVIGMAHRGRLNVLVNLIGKAPAELFDEFEGRAAISGSGDVKYHQGFSSNVVMDRHEMHLALAFNPSHLAIVGPVVAGSVRGRQDRRRLQPLDDKPALAVLVHGDAAFAGQGVVMESLQMSQTRGYHIGGTIHVIVNNQIGFTTSNPADSRSTEYCTDVAKMIEAPIFHVNGDDPEAAVFISELAFEYRQRFQKDVVVDLFSYRRRGHNEADEPSITQPEMYRAIRAHKTTRTLHAEALERRGLVDTEQAQAMVTKYRALLDDGSQVAHHIAEHPDTSRLVDWKPYLNQDPRQADRPDVTPTAVPAARLRELSDISLQIPADFALQRQVSKVVEARLKMGADERPFDWGGAEILAYASVLAEGYPVRLTGQDVRRGTFSHRHATLRDQRSGSSHTPLQRPDLDWAPFFAYDSLLSEMAVLGFEYGYATTQPDALVIWEAQFGDFANNAQVVIDQFISSGANKWGRLCNLVMLLPHGYEGQGAEHSSARLERFMQLCAEDNMRLCAPTTPAQIFHLLRRQVISRCRLPLVVMSPKSLLRHPMAVSPRSALSDGHFHCVLDDDAIEAPERVRQLVLCSGKVYYELLEMRNARGLSDIAIVRIEQIYPFPYDEFTNAIRRYPQLEETVWCQEEPRNQGAWLNGRHRIIRVLERECPGVGIRYAGRPPSPSPAVGQQSMHAEEQRHVAEQALGLAEAAA